MYTCKNDKEIDSIKSETIIICNQGFCWHFDWLQYWRIGNKKLRLAIFLAPIFLEPEQPLWPPRYNWIFLKVTLNTIKQTNNNFLVKTETISYHSVFLLWLLHVLTREIIFLFSFLCFQKEHTKHLVDVTGYPVTEGSLSPENNKCQLITHKTFITN